MTPLGYKNLKLEISNPVLWGLKPSIMRLKLGISETQTQYYETQTRYFWDSN